MIIIIIIMLHSKQQVQSSIIILKINLYFSLFAKQFKTN